MCPGQQTGDPGPRHTDVYFVVILCWEVIVRMYVDAY
jgi:hypothetical protein